jgi:DNA polymerase III epsilon subunit-like protein
MSEFSSGWDDSEFDRPEGERIHRVVPPLMVGFDLETTGLDVKHDQPISYGFTEYRDGKQTGVKHHFIVKPTVPIHEKASAVNGWTADKLEKSYNGEIVTDFSYNKYAPALDPRIGVQKAASILSDYQKQGAVIVGANHHKFDFAMLSNTYKTLNAFPIETTGLVPPRVSDEKNPRVFFDPTAIKTIDVISHDRRLDPEQYAYNHPLYRSRSLENLAKHYQVEPSSHIALDDARASVDVYLRQVERNKKGIMRP